MIPIQQILVPVDFSAVSLQALDYAVELAKTFKAEITTVHVLEPLYYAAVPTAYSGEAQMAMLIEDQRKMAREQLAKLAEALRKKGLASRALLQEGTPYERILASAKRVKADLIVMATHGRTGLSHLLMGSVTEKVIRSATCPVLTLHGYKAKAKLARGRASSARKK